MRNTMRRRWPAAFKLGAAAMLVMAPIGGLAHAENQRSLQELKAELGMYEVELAQRQRTKFKPVKPPAVASSGVRRSEPSETSVNGVDRLLKNQRALTYQKLGEQVYIQVK